MSITYEAIKKANDTIRTTPIQGKDYAEVNQRIKAFRMVYPDGTIKTEMLSNENGVCVFKAEIYDGEKLLGTGHAYEKEGSTFINKTSYLENSETSSIGRALGMCGFGIDVSVASAEEVQNAMANQTEEKEEKKASARQVEILKKYYKGANLTKLLESNKIEKVEDILMSKASELISKLMKKEQKDAEVDS